MNEYAQRLQTVLREIPDGVEIVAVSKTHPAAAIQALYELGHRSFGENKVQELCAKQEELPKDIRWHMIGHLQRNKVRYIVPFVHLIHSVDSDRLLAEIDKQGGKINRVVDCLLQVRIAREETKFGLDETEVEQLLEACGQGQYPWVRVRGLMGMATLTGDFSQITQEFRGLKLLYDRLSVPNPSMDTLSMGMSGDYRIAIAEGSTMVRLGSSIFGARAYSN